MKKIFTTFAILCAALSINAAALDTVEVVCNNVFHFHNENDNPYADPNDPNDCWFEIIAQSSDMYYSVNITINSKTIVGTYGPEDFDYTYSNIQRNGSQQEIKSAHGSVTENNGNYFFDMFLDCADSIYHVFISHGSQLYYTGDVPNADYGATFQWDDVEMDDQYFAEYQIIELNAINEYDQTVGLEFRVTELMDDDYMIPAATYTIGRTGIAPEVTASQGLIGEGVTRSFAGYRTSDGYLDMPTWYLIEGTVKVTRSGENIDIEVNATNSANRTIHVIVSNHGTGLTDIRAAKEPSEKFIRNGQLIIRRNGQEYNAQGAVQQSCN